MLTGIFSVKVTSWEIGSSFCCPELFCKYSYRFKLSSFAFKIPTGTNFQHDSQMPLADAQAFFSTFKASNILFCPPHISGSQQEAQIADHNSLVITYATFSRNCQKISLWFTKHFSFLHYPCCPESCSYYPQCVTVIKAKSLVCLHLGQTCFLLVQNNTS